MRLVLFSLVLVLVLLSAPDVLADKASGDGAILVPVGTDWKLGYQVAQDGMILREYVRIASGETMENWTELLSVTVNPGLQKKTDAYSFAEGMLSLSKAKCADGLTIARLEKQGREALSQWAIKGCLGFFPDQTTLLRTFVTRDALCSVQYAWKTPPRPEAVRKATELIQKVTIVEAP